MMIFTQKIHERGQVMLVTVVFFLIISMVIVLGVATPILKQASIARESLLSKQSYYAAESSIEDIFSRLQKNGTIAPSETFTLGSAQVTITTTDIIGGKQVIAEGSVNSNIRKLQTVFGRGTGVVFRYGTQSGQGGVELENNSALVGTLYSNGNITGANGSYITGDAYAAGPAGLINNVDIGVGGTGVAHAHTVQNSTITGTLYCQTGSGNNKACNTSLPDPEPIPLPIKDEDIAEWKADATAGGIYSGNMIISTPTTLGPQKIAGNLTINDSFTLANTVYVTGNIIINGNVKLSSTYGASSGVIIADGYIDINNGVVFQDSGTTGSYILFLSESICDASMNGSPCNGNYAIDVGNNSSISIANAQKGTVYFSNNSSVKEAVGYKIRLKNNSTISYGSGIINPNFTSGPAGGYNISYFGEVQ